MEHFLSGSASFLMVDEMILLQTGSYLSCKRESDMLKLYFHVQPVLGYNVTQMATILGECDTLLEILTLRRCSLTSRNAPPQEHLSRRLAKAGFHMIATIAGEWFQYDSCDRCDRTEVFFSDRCRCDHYNHWKVVSI